MFLSYPAPPPSPPPPPLLPPPQKKTNTPSKRDKQKPCDPVETVVFFFRRLTDRENFHKVTDQVNLKMKTGGGCTHATHAHSSMYGHSPSRPYRTMRGRVACWVFTDQAGIDCLHQARSAVRGLAGRMKGELHPARNCARDVGCGFLCVRS